MNEILLRMDGIRKTFPGVVALDGARIEVRRGEVHALIGENGAGKSTLMKILTGVYRRDAGRIVWKDRPVEIETPRAAQEMGISIIYQEFNLMPHLTVAQNIMIGREPRAKLNFVIRERELNRLAAGILESLKIRIDPEERVSKLSVAKQQMVEIAKAVSYNSELLIMDEPTAALTEGEINELFSLIADLKAKGVAVIYISHRLEELKKIADRVTVMRDGKYIDTVEFAETSLDRLISMMVGRDIAEQFPKQFVSPGETVLEVKNLVRNGVLKNVSFSLRKGEILGVAGLMGAGRTETARAVFGADRIDSGEVVLEGRPVKIRSPEDAIRVGIGYLTEDRKKEGLALGLAVDENVVLASIGEFANRAGVMNDRKVGETADEFVRSLSIKTPSLDQKVKFLSGGNQQKVIIARWLCRQAKVLIFDEPTRGIDVGAKHEVYELMNRLTAGGASIVMISSELPEILGMSDRILVMHEGAVAGILPRSEATQEKILYLATGGV